MTVQGSARESLHWLDWFVRLRRALLVGACCSGIGAAALLYVGLRTRGVVVAGALLFSLVVPCLALLFTLLKALSVATTMAQAVREREHQLTSAKLEKLELTRRVAHREGDRASAAGSPVEAGPEALGAIARDLREPLQLIESNVAVLSEAFGDILPMLDQQAAVGPHLRIARLDYPFFRERVPAILSDLGAGTARIAGVARSLAAPARHLPPRSSPPAR